MTTTHTLKSISETTGISVSELHEKLIQNNIAIEDTNADLSTEAISLLTGKSQKSKLSLGSLKTLSLNKPKKKVEKPIEIKTETPAKIEKPSEPKKPEAQATIKPAEKTPEQNKFKNKAPLHEHKKTPPVKEDFDKNEKKSAKPKAFEPRKKDRHIVVSYNDEDAMQPASNFKRGSRKGKKKLPPTKPSSIEIYEGITVSELARLIKINGQKLVKQLNAMDRIYSLQQVIQTEDAILLAAEFDINAKIKPSTLIENNVQDDSGYEQMPRAPIVTIMGHVDHGKTTLLDYLRESRITDDEAGGITQHIGAYQVHTENGTITFIDTPGHAAFTAMRAHGANVTDIVILVIASDDGIMPQTIEAIEHAKAAEAPVIVAITKIDKPAANPEEIKSQLAQHNLVPEEWGGDTMTVQLSAVTGEGIPKLLESVLLQAEIMELTAADKGPGKSTVLEARLEKNVGPCATLIHQTGSLSVGDVIVAGSSYGKIRRINDDCGHMLKNAMPSMPIEIIGLDTPPAPGDQCRVVKNEKQARNIVDQRKQLAQKSSQISSKPQSLEDIFANVKDTDEKIMHIVLKTDTQGSLLAIKNALDKIEVEDIALKIIYNGVGAINLSDVQLAQPNDALIIAFNVRADNPAKKELEKAGIKPHYSSIIYELIQRIKEAMIGLAGPKYEEEIIGLAEVREVFKSSKTGCISGCMVLEGILKRHAHIRVIRDHKVIYTGKLNSLRRFTQDAEEVRKDTECGLGIKDYDDIQIGDQIEAFIEVEKKLTDDL